MEYDYLIVGSGLFGATCAFLLKEKGFSVAICEKRGHVGGNIFTENVNGINVHKYGAHIFHTSNKTIWDFINQFAEFNNFINSPLANFHGEIFHLPFNMNTFIELWPDVKTPSDAKKHIDNEKGLFATSVPKNLEEQAIALVGTTIYKKLIREYTEKQWGRKCTDLPPFIIKRIPLRFAFDNNYFDDTYQGIPKGGYTQIIEKMIEGVDVYLSTEFVKNNRQFPIHGRKTIFTGAIDEYFSFCYGKLEYRTLRFVNRRLNIPDFQGNAVINYTSHEKPFTRIIEHKHFEFGKQDFTIISEEYPDNWVFGKERFYPVNDTTNGSLFNRYSLLAEKEKNVFFGGRLGEYRYYDMDDTIQAAFDLVQRILSEN